MKKFIGIVLHRQWPHLATSDDVRKKWFVSDIHDFLSNAECIYWTHSDVGSMNAVKSAGTVAAIATSEQKLRVDNGGRKGPEIDVTDWLIEINKTNWKECLVENHWLRLDMAESLFEKTKARKLTELNNQRRKAWEDRQA